MYKLFAAAQAIEFSVGCHARWSNFVVKSNEFPLASTPGLSAPEQTSQYFQRKYPKWQANGKGRWEDKKKQDDH